jgi:hypothetical protein
MLPNETTRKYGIFFNKYILKSAAIIYKKQPKYRYLLVIILIIVPMPEDFFRKKLANEAVRVITRSII